LNKVIIVRLSCFIGQKARLFLKKESALTKMTEDGTLKQLQRLNADMQQVLARRRHVAVYSLKLDGSGREIWEREKLEGSLFLVKRKVEPKYAICILNRKAATDLFEPLKFGDSDFEYEIKDNFLIYRVFGNIRAVWFAQEDDDDGNSGMHTIRESLQLCEREVLSVPPLPKYVSKSCESDDPLTMEEMRDALLRLIGNDKFMQTLHAQYMATAEGKRSKSVSRDSAGATTMMIPHQSVSPLIHPVQGNMTYPGLMAPLSRHAESLDRSQQFALPQQQQKPAMYYPPPPHMMQQQGSQRTHMPPPMNYPMNPNFQQQPPQMYWQGSTNQVQKPQ